MNTSKMTKEAVKAFESYRKGDPVMVRKSLALRDVGYRKHSPERELWHAELAFDYDFYLAVLVFAVAAVAVFLAARRMIKKLCFMGRGH